MKIPAGINVSPPTPAQATVAHSTIPGRCLRRIDDDGAVAPQPLHQQQLQPSYTGDIASSMKKLMAGNPNLKDF